jgi:hypothetical protein
MLLRFHLPPASSLLPPVHRPPELEVAKRKEEGSGGANLAVQTVILEYIQTTDNSVVKVFDVIHHTWNAWTGDSTSTTKAKNTRWSPIPSSSTRISFDPLQPRLKLSLPLTLTSSRNIVDTVSFNAVQL